MRFSLKQLYFALVIGLSVNGCAFIERQPTAEGELWNDAYQDDVAAQTVISYLPSAKSDSTELVASTPWGSQRQLAFGETYFSGNGEQCRRVEDIESKQSLLFCKDSEGSWYAQRDLLTQ